MKSKKILGLGHPRTGTGYTSHMLKYFGFKVGHEIMKEDGIVAWQLAPILEKKEDLPFMHRCKDVFFDTYNWETIIYNIRNPKDSICSICYTETKTLNFRNRIAKIETENNRVSMAIQSILYFDEVILNKNPNIIYRIEHDIDKLYEFLNERYAIKWNDLIEIVAKDKKNKRKHPDLIELKDEIESVSDELKGKINSFCEKYNYPKFY